MQRDSIIFYRSFYEAIKELPLEVQATVYSAIFEYSLNFNKVELSGLPKTIFTLIKPQLDANNKRFENGSKGGRKKANSEQIEKEKEPKQNQNVTKVEANNNVNNNANQNNNTNKKVDSVSIADRKLKFSSTLEPFLEKYGREMLKSFNAYWTEQNKTKTKMRFESEKFWDLSKRLATWNKNDKFKGGDSASEGDTKFPKPPPQTIKYS